jgi:RimJ/RimL family protein N-acetyltransferase
MLETSRLKLVPLTHQQLLLFKNDQKALAQNLGINHLEPQNDPMVVGDIAEAIQFWISHTLKYPNDFQWFTNWIIILKEEQVIIGGVGFAGLPDEQGRSIIGYGLDIRYHNRGFASEALQMIIKWGFRNDNLKRIIADTGLPNTPSHRVLIKNGFLESGRNEEVISWYLNRS